jgi:hypothetical protein
MGMLDEMEGAGAVAEASAAPLRAPGVKGKAKGKASPIGQSKQNTLLGMPPLVVYCGGLVGSLLLFGGLTIVYVVTKPATPQGPTPSPTIAVQAPAVGTAAPTPGKGPAPSGQSASPNGTTPPTPGAGAAGAVSTAPPALEPMPGNAASPGTQPAPTSPMPTPAAPPVVERVEWRNRIPVVRLTTGRFKSERAQELGENEVAIELLTVPPISPRVQPNAAEISAILPIYPTIIQTQKSIESQLKQMTDLASTKQRATQWADFTAQGLDQIRKTDRLSGLSLPSKDKNLEYDAMLSEEGPVMSAQAEFERLARIPGAIDALEAALKERAAREPNGALAETLKQAPSQ